MNMSGRQWFQVLVIEFLKITNTSLEHWGGMTGEGSNGHVVNTDNPEASQTVMREAKPRRGPKITQTN